MIYTPQILYPRLITQTSFENSKIISYGLIMIEKDTYDCIVVQRLHSVEFLLILSGQYRPSLICLLMPHITLEEIDIFQKLIDNHDLYKEVFINVGYDEKDYEYAYIRFLESKHIIQKSINKYNHNNDLKWTFPKGRLNIEDKEDGYSCACREFIEEVEHDLPEPLYISENYITIETIKTLGCKLIETRCWVYVVKDKFELLLTSNKEVSNRKWTSLNEALELMNKKSLYDDIVNMISK
jgi:ADP-ribose pyrophosphatase YjhB (NUDIX family)